MSMFFTQKAEQMILSQVQIFMKTFHYDYIITIKLYKILFHPNNL